MVEKLSAALKSVDWNNNVEIFLNSGSDRSVVENSVLRLAIWSKQLEMAENGNPALSFIREMQSSGHMVVATTGLALYRAAAGSIRTIFEAALYYTYYRSHLVELATLVRDPKFHLSKSDIIEYHKIHTRNFSKVQKNMDFIGNMDEWYREISSIIHGQVPGKWLSQKSFNDIKFNENTQKMVSVMFSKGVRMVEDLFLCTIAAELWDNFSSPAKRQILHGLSGELKETLQLDSA